MKQLKSLRLHIGIFGKTNVGKSSLINAISGQDVAIVSETSGTTTDVVEKSMELFPVGAVNFLDTAGINDLSELGKLRVDKTFKVIDRTDIALVVVDYNGIDDFELNLFEKFNERNIPFIVIVNKSDIRKISDLNYKKITEYTNNIIMASAINSDNLTDILIEKLIEILPEEYITPPSITGDLVSAEDTVILVIPIDKEAPKGRLILPQVQTIRDILDNNCLSLITDVQNLHTALKNLKSEPKLVITDSQAFKKVAEIVPKTIPLTSFSILFARLKGDLDVFTANAKYLDNLTPDSKILILESCTHHQIDDDIARVKIPKLIEKKLGFLPKIDYYTGHDFPDISVYQFVIHCGACMTNRREVLSRIMTAKKLKIPITNYGIIISYCLGILKRATEIFGLSSDF